MGHLTLQIWQCPIEKGGFSRPTFFRIILNQYNSSRKAAFFLQPSLPVKTGSVLSEEIRHYVCWWAHRGRVMSLCINVTFSFEFGSVFLFLLLFGVYACTVCLFQDLETRRYDVHIYFSYVYEHETFGWLQKKGAQISMLQSFHLTWCTCGFSSSVTCFFLAQQSIDRNSIAVLRLVVLEDHPGGCKQLGSPS